MDNHTLLIILFCIFQSYIEQGLFAFTYGSKQSLVDFVHVDNLVQAHVLAGLALTGPNPKAVSKEDTNYIDTISKVFIIIYGYNYP